MFIYIAFNSNKFLLKYSLENSPKDFSEKGSSSNKEDNWKKNINSLPAYKF